MNTGVWLTLIIGFLVIVLGLLIATRADRRRNLRVARLYEKRIVIFEKVKKKVYDEELCFIHNDAFLRRRGTTSTGPR
jgi:hypothetical protein